MIKYALFLLAIIVVTDANAILSSCPNNHRIIMNDPGIPHCYISSFTKARYWCLSGGSENNSGSSKNILFYGPRSDNNCYVRANWKDPDVQGCCGMWDASSFDSNILMATIEQWSSWENSIFHYGEYISVLAEKEGKGFNLPDAEFNAIPVFEISDAKSTGAGGFTLITLSGWGKMEGPAHYRLRLRDGSICDDCILDKHCSPNGNSPCPSPIIGYQIRATTAPCADKNCLLPAPPITSLVSAWNIAVINGNISGRDPVFPIKNIQVTNPAECNSSNRFLFVATQIRYADGYASSFVSGNSIPIDWCNLNPMGIATNFPLKLELKTSSSTITCNDELEITVKLLNNSQNQIIDINSAWITTGKYLIISVFDAKTKEELMGDVGLFRFPDELTKNKITLNSNEFIGRRLLLRLEDGLLSLKNPFVVERLSEIWQYDVGDKDFILQGIYRLSFPQIGEIKVLTSNDILITNQCKKGGVPKWVGN